MKEQTKTCKKCGSSFVCEKPSGRFLCDYCREHPYAEKKEYYPHHERDAMFIDDADVLI